MKVFGFLSTLVILFASANVPEDWLPWNANYIYLSNQTASFDDSQQACVNKNASLFIIKSESEKYAITKLLNKAKGYRVGYRLTPNGWRWLDNSTYFPLAWWRPGDPHSVDTTAYFLFYKDHWNFDGHTSIAMFHYICEKKCGWRKLNDTEKGELCGVEFMPNCDGLSCDSVCLRHPGCSSYAIWSNTCVNLKNRAEAGEHCVVKLPLHADEYTLACN